MVEHLGMVSSKEKERRYKFIGAAEWGVDLKRQVGRGKSDDILCLHI